MLDIHPPHHAATTWRDFFIHIATIVIGLLIAVGLEQMVEAVHHRHQRRQLEEQLLEVLDNNLAIDAFDFRESQAFRAYLVDLQATVVARRHGQPLPMSPPPDDPRMVMHPRFPSLAPYDAAQQNGVVAVLPSSEIRLYNRLALQRGLLLTEVQTWVRAVIAWESFDQRFVDSRGSAGFGGLVTAPDLKELSPAEVIEYQTLIASLIKQTDVVEERFRYFDTECRSILRGNRDENTMIDNLTRQRPTNPQPVSQP